MTNPLLVASCVTALIALVFLYKLVKPRNEVWESMTRFELGQRVVRVWREEDEACYGPDPEIILIYRTFDEYTLDPEILQRLGDLPRVSAVEILRQGDGILRYPDWR